MNIKNPYFKVNEERNIFIIREQEYSKILENVREILKPVEELGFTIAELDLREHKFSSGELNKTLRENLVIRLQKGNSEVDLSMLIPKLVGHNYIIINGRKKIPQFQLIDTPIVTRGQTIKLRTNVATLTISEEKEAPFIQSTFLNKKVSFALLMFSYFGPEELERRYNLSNLKPESDSLINKLMSDLKMYETESEGMTQDNFILELGRNYSKFNSKSKGEDIVYALDLVLKTDIMSRKFFEKDNVIDEMISVIEKEELDDTLFTNKRVRCFEYMILSKVSKAVFDLCLSNRTTRQPKFNVNSTQILSECNVSDIVQFDFSINPIEELTKLSRISLLGPGGFKRENVPAHLRDIYPSMMGRICPVDTPDRDNCGVLQDLLPNVKLDENLRFTEEILDKQPISVPVSFIPFLEHDDQTRLQMASSQMRQAIMLKEFDVPMIQSGCEGLFTSYTQFIKKAKKDGEVIYQDPNFIIVIYNDKEVDIFDISYRKIYVENMDFMNVYVRTGDKFKAGEILAESNFCLNGEVQFGKNLLTAVMSYYGNNYEDGIVISDRLVKEGIFTSVHYKDLSFTLPPNKVLLTLDEERYKPLPDIYETIEVGKPYAIMKEISSENHFSVFEEKTQLEAQKKLIITEVNIYPNIWNSEIPEFRQWIETKIEEQQERENYFKQVLKDSLPKDVASSFIRDKGLDKFSFVEKYKVKKERINGVRIELFGVYFRQIQVGDKIANRHGNKGVISQIVEHEKMPQLEDGRHVDICINPLGIISRMNIGQLYELHLVMSLEDLKEEILKRIRDEKYDSKKVRKYLLDYIKIIDNTEGNWYTKQFIEQCPKVIDENFIKNLTLIQPPFESITRSKIEQALKYTKTMLKYKIFDPVSKSFLENDIAVGFIYFFKMIHIAEERLAARGIGPYARRTLQPLGGRKNKGGQRCGEMETACLISHDAPIDLHEFLTTKSDCIDLKNEYIRNFIEAGLVPTEEEIDTTPESVKLLKAYLTAMGVSQR